PHFYIKQVINAEPLAQLRDQLKHFNLKVTYNDMVIKACALALRQHPSVNAGFNSVNQTIVQFKTIDISVAVTIEEGLITPIVRIEAYKILGQTWQEVGRFAELARKMKLPEQDYKGGSFCVSNLALFGFIEFGAITIPLKQQSCRLGALK